MAEDADEKDDTLDTVDSMDDAVDALSSSSLNPFTSSQTVGNFGSPAVDDAENTEKPLPVS